MCCVDRLSSQLKADIEKKGKRQDLTPHLHPVVAHFSAIVGDGFKTLSDGQPVEFVLVQGEKGPQAEQITAL